MTKPQPVSPPTRHKAAAATRRPSLWSTLFLLAVAPIAVALILYRVDDFDPAPLPEEAFSGNVMPVPKRNSRMLQGAEVIGLGLLPGPEDFAYDTDSRLLYTGCGDGWIKRVTVTESAANTTVENWVHVGGQPLGLALGRDKQLIVAESDKGLMRVTPEGQAELLTDEAEGLKFRLTDGVDVADDGTIYFTDASSKYALKDHILDIFEGRPYGRLMSFDSSTNRTQVLVRDLYFANGVAVSPDQSFVIFCETVLRRCRRYYIKGEKKGSIDDFASNLPGFPDNIRYDGEEGQYWIALATANTFSWNLALRYPVVRKALVALEKLGRRLHTERDGGVLAVDLEGKALAHYYDAGFTMVTAGVRIGDHLYCGGLIRQHITRLDLKRHPATAV